MNAGEYNRVMAVIDAVMDADTGDRQALLSELCAGDDDLRLHVEELLKQNTAAKSFMEELPDVAVAIGGAAMIGRTIGNYRITDELGRGGMGTVYLAERCDGAFDQRVAIKLIKKGMDSDAIVGRFLNERRILATLEHPHIARLIDGGTTDDGSPYFIMEFVDGSPIDDYVRQHALTIDDRLALFALVCDAVYYAHTRQIIHRDIKPSNILVSDEGRPKLLDFGISKVVDPEGGDKSTVTETAWRLLTPEYASPEQILGSPVTNRTDVYSLGILLCELLTGRGPYDFPSRSPLDLARTICEQQPRLPSTLAGREDPETSDGRPAVTTTALRDLKRRLRGDLDRLVLTCLEKDPAHRYVSAAALAVDIRRHLHGQRILAPRPNLIQRISAYFKTTIVGRWRPSFSLAVLLLVAVMSFGGALWLVGRGATQPKIDSLAVLPFKYQGHGDPSIGPGVTEGLITSLGRTKQFDLRPLRAVMAYASAETRDLRLISDTLHVDAVLDGTIQEVGSNLDVAITFFDQRSGSVLWTYQFREPQQNVAKVQQDVYQELVRRLSITENSSRPARTRNAAAYEAFLKGRFQWNKRTPDAYERAISFFNQAIALDAEYAEAYSGLADAYALLACVIEQFDKRAERMKLARQYAETAISLDPGLAQPYATIGFMGWHYEWDWTGSDIAFRKAIELDPSYPTAHHWYAYLLVRVNRMDEAVAEIRRAQSLDPLSQIIATDVGEILLWAGRYREAIEAGAKVAEMRGDDVDELYVLTAYSLSKDSEGYVAAAQKKLRQTNRDPEQLVGLAGWYFTNGKPDEARKLFAEARAKPGWSKLKDPAVHFSREESIKRVLPGLEREYFYRAAWITMFATHPDTAWCRSDPRIQEYIRLTGLAPYALPASD